MTDPPVSTSEIADLLHHIRELSDHPTSNLTDRTEVLARKADLLARLAARHADEWVCEHADQARQLAHQAQILATQARVAVTPEQRDTIDE